MTEITSTSGDAPDVIAQARSTAIYRGQHCWNNQVTEEQNEQSHKAFVSAIDHLIAVVQAEQQKKDHGAGLTGQAIPDVAETLPRPSKRNIFLDKFIEVGDIKAPDGWTPPDTTVVQTPREVCAWLFDGDTWRGSCGATWEFLADGPPENKMRFCPECGGQVTLVQPDLAPAHLRVSAPREACANFESGVARGVCRHCGNLFRDHHDPAEPRLNTEAQPDGPVKGKAVRAAIDALIAAVRSSLSVTAGRYQENLEVALVTLARIARRDGGPSEALMRAVQVAEHVLTQGSVTAGDGRGWLQIESAPKDGTRLLVLTLFPKGVGAQSPQMVTADFSHNSWSTLPGRYTVHPTHWMPLPPAPSAKLELDR